MFRLLLHIAILAALLIAPAALADDDKPTIGLVTFGAPGGARDVEAGIYAILQANGYLSNENRGLLYQEQSIEDEHINLMLGDAGFDFANANLLVDAMLDSGANILITVSTPMTLAALNATSDMADPPLILFANSVSPYAAGVADSPCEKAPNLTGVETVVKYDEIVPVMQLQRPDLARIGVLHSSNEISGRIGADSIAAAAADRNIEVATSAIAEVSELRAATEGLVAKGVEALIVPWDLSTASGLPTIAEIAANSGIPLFYAYADAVMYGAMIGVGFSQPLEQGMNLGHILSAYLDGELDIANTAISSLDRSAISVNETIDGIELTDELLAVAEVRMTEQGMQADPMALMGRMMSMGITMEMLMELMQSDLTQNNQNASDTKAVFDQVFTPMLVEVYQSDAGKQIAADFLASLDCAAM